MTGVQLLGALPRVTALLSSKNASDVLESIQYLVLCKQFSVQGCEVLECEYVLMGEGDSHLCPQSDREEFARCSR